MSASLLFERRFLKQFAAVPSDYAPASSLAEVFVERVANGWDVNQGIGLIPLVTSASTSPNFYLYNPKISLGINRLVKATFSVAATTDQIGIIARGKNTPCNGQGAIYNNGNLQACRFYDVTGTVTFQGFGAAWVPTINTQYNLYAYARSLNASDTTVKAWSTSATNLLTHLADGTTFTDSQSDTQGSSNPTVTGFGPFTLDFTNGTYISRIQCWTVDGTFSACGSVTSAATGVTLEVFPIDGTGPYTIQWYRSLTATGTFSVITGATTSMYLYTGGTEGVKEHYKAIVTDTGNANATATSDVMPGMKTKSAQVIAIAADSWGVRTINADNAGNNNIGSLSDLYARYLACLINRPVTIVNGAVSGITAAQFRDTYMSTHLAACAVAGVTYAKIRFGANYTAATNADTIISVAQGAADDIQDIANAYIAAGIVPIVSDAQCVLPYGRSGRGAYTSDTMDRINVDLLDIVNGSSILAGDKGQNLFCAANTDCMVDQLHLDETYNHLLAVREAARDAFLIDPDSLGVPLAEPVGDNLITIGECVDTLNDVCRSAGIADVNNKNYTLAQKHRAMRYLFEDFTRRTRCLQAIDSFTITSGSSAVDLTSITGFSSERGVEYWIDGEDRPLNVMGYQEINNLLANDTSSTKPCRIGFRTPTAVGKVFPTPDAAYTGQVRWWTPITGWTPGDTSVAEVVLNLPRDLAVAVIFAGGVFALQANSPEHATLAAQSRKEYEALVMRNMGSGNFGVQAVDVRSPRGLNDWIRGW